MSGCAGFIQAFGYTHYIVPMDICAVDFEELKLPPIGAGAGFFMDNTSEKLNDADVIEAFDPYTMTVGADVQALDGTDSPAKLLGLTASALSTDTNTESSQTYDTTSQGFELGVATSKTATLDLSGNAQLGDVGYKLLRVCEKQAVSQNLGAKLVRVGPVGTTETIWGFGRFTNFSENNDAGSIVGWELSFEFYGPYNIKFDGQTATGGASIKNQSIVTPKKD
jgi:hypothetical protein